MPSRREPLTSVGPGFSWGPSLILVCLVVGLLLGVLELERGRGESQRGLINGLQTRLDIMRGDQEDLGRFMADPHTRLIRLDASDVSHIGAATIAWNESQRRGALYCDQLPPLSAGLKYEVWANTPTGQASRLDQIDAVPGTSIYAFGPVTGIGAVTRIEVTAGPPNSASKPLLSASWQSSPDAIGG